MAYFIMGMFGGTEAISVAIFRVVAGHGWD